MIFVGGKLMPNLAFAPLDENQPPAGWAQVQQHAAPACGAANTIPKQMAKQQPMKGKGSNKKRKADDEPAPPAAADPGCSVAAEFDVQVRRYRLTSG